MKTWEAGAGLGWDAAASGSVIGSDVHENGRKYNVMARTFRSLGKQQISFTPSCRRMYQEEHINLGEGAGLGWVVTASGSVIGSDLTVALDSSLQLLIVPSD